MEGLIKWLLIGGVGYFVARELGIFGPVTGPSLLPSGSQSSGGVLNPTVIPTATPAHKSALLTLASQDSGYKANGGKMGYDAWNYYLQKIIPTPVISWENTPAAKVDRSYLWNIDEFWGFVSANGISGLGMMREPLILQNIRSGGGANYWERYLIN